jgi:hypothetical protein
VVSRIVTTTDFPVPFLSFSLPAFCAARAGVFPTNRPTSRPLLVTIVNDRSSGFIFFFFFFFFFFFVLFFLFFGVLSFSEGV